MRVPDTSNPRASASAGAPATPGETRTTQPSNPAGWVPPSETASLFGPGAGAPGPRPARVLLDRHLRRHIDPPGRDAAERAIRGLLESGDEPGVEALLVRLVEVGTAKENPGGWIVAELRRCVADPSIREWWATRDAGPKPGATPGASSGARDPLGSAERRARVVGDLGHAIGQALGRPARPALGGAYLPGTPAWLDWQRYMAEASLWDRDHAQQLAQLQALATRALEVRVLSGEHPPSAERTVLGLIEGREWEQLEALASGEVRP